MACLNKLSGSIRNGCDTGSVGISDLILINFSDVTSGVTDSAVTFTLGAAASVYAVDSTKKSINASEAARINENAPNGIEQTISFTMFAKDAPKAGAATSKNAVLANDILNSRFIAVVRTKDGVYRAYGVNFGLELESLEESANDNGGFTTFTIKTPDGVLGESRLVLAAGEWPKLVAKIKE